MTDKQIIEKLRDIECQLSPENLTCDGELPRAEVQRRYRALVRAQGALIKQLGRMPTTKELFPELVR